MKETTKQMLKLFFNEGETICVSPDKYGYHSINPLDIDKEMCLISPNEKIKPKFIKEKDISLVTINPIKGFRTDSNVTAFRSFLIEMDEGNLPEQNAYIDSLKMPYSICLFSGNKSLHYGIVLSKDLVNIDVWRLACNWILNVVKKADQQTKNPSRNIRFPDHSRKDGRKLKQTIVDVRRRITQDELFIWLNNWPKLKPKPEIEEKSYDPSRIPDINKMPEWFFETLGRLRDGTQSQRNNTWYSLACTMAAYNFTLDDMISFLDQFFLPEDDFKKREWLVCIKSGYKRIDNG